MELTKLHPDSIKDLAVAIAEIIKPNKLLTVKEAAEEFKMNPATIRLHFNEGRLKGERFGSKDIRIYQNQKAA